MHQTQPQANAVPLSGAVCLIETVKDSADGFFVHANTVILDDELGRSLLMHSDGYRAAIVGELHCVVNQVDPYLGEKLGIRGARNRQKI